MKKFLGVLAALVLSQAMVAAETMDLGQLLTQAENNNPNVVQLKQQINMLKSQGDALYGIYDTHLNMTAGLNFQKNQVTGIEAEKMTMLSGSLGWNKKMENGISLGLSADTNFQNTTYTGALAAFGLPSDLATSKIGANFSMPLSQNSGGILDRLMIESTLNQINQQKISLEQKLRDERYNVYQAYLQAQLTMRLIKLRQETLERNKEYEKTKPALMIKAALDILHEQGQVFEVRIPKTKAGTISGYFNDTTIAASAIARENGKHPAIYTTLNPVSPDIIARSENRLSVFDPRTSSTTADSEVLRRRWMAVDLDPVRPSGISSTDEEVSAAAEVGGLIVEWLYTLGWPLPLQACSGNGWHLLYRVDLPNDDTSRTNIEFALKTLSYLFSTDKINVDTTVFNASRVWKVYGTISAKGSHTSSRPHRVATIREMPEELILVDPGKIDHLASGLRDAKSDEFKDYTGEYISDMVKWLSDRGQTVVSGPRPMFGNEGQKWIISRCPFNPSHAEPMVGLAANRPVFRCLHNSCSAFKWKEFREKIDPTI
jgi:hypothetical protein